MENLFSIFFSQCVLLFHSRDKWKKNIVWKIIIHNSFSLNYFRFSIRFGLIPFDSIQFHLIWSVLTHCCRKHCATLWMCLFKNLSFETFSKRIPHATLWFIVFIFNWTHEWQYMISFGSRQRESEMYSV